MRVVAIVLHLGNIDFQESPQNSDETVVSNTDELHKASSCLGTTNDILSECLCFREVSVRGETMKVPLTVERAYDSRNSMAMYLYATTFRWVVERCNISLSGENNSNTNNTNTNNTNTNTNNNLPMIGILDIFGFEIFEHNSFEQVCINYVNEKLQQVIITIDSY